MATTITVSGNGSSGPYSVSAIDWHPYGLLQEQSIVFKLDAAGSATQLTYGDDYIFDQAGRTISLVGDTISSQESLRVTRETPDTFFASLPDLGVADAISAKSNDIQVMNRLSEVEADLAEVSGEVSLTFDGDAFTSVSAGSNINMSVSGSDLLISSTATGGGGGGGGFTDAQFGNGKPTQSSGTSPVLLLNFDTTGFYGASELSTWFVDNNIVDTTALNTSLSNFRGTEVANDIAAALSDYDVKTISNSDGKIGVTNTSGDVELSYTGPDPVAAPTGSMVMWCGSSANLPDGWALCDGSAVDSTSDATFADLFAIIGTTFGGSGAASFNLPDMRGSVPVGVNGLSPELGGTGGADSVMLDGSNLPEHRHQLTRVQSASASTSGRTFRIGNDGATGVQSVSVSLSTSGQYRTGSTIYEPTGNDTFGTQTSVDVRQPFVGVHYIIKK